MKQTNPKEMKSMSAVEEIRPLGHISVKCFDLCGIGTESLTKQELFVEDTCKMTFCLCGNLKSHACKNGKKCETLVTAGRCCFHYCPGPCRCFESACGEGTKNLQLLFPCRSLVALLGESRLPPEVKGNSSGITHIIREITPAMNRIVHQIKNTNVHGNEHDLFFPVKALELFWLFFRSEGDLTPVRVKVCDRKAIQRARVILENNLDEPPALKELAAQVGMSVSKFKQLFPKECGVTPYVYLRKMRMKKARNLLITGAMNVTEAAMEVGYNSPSHFTEAFVRQFGVKPSQLRERM